MDRKHLYRKQESSIYSSPPLEGAQLPRLLLQHTPKEPVQSSGMKLKPAPPNGTF